MATQSAQKVNSPQLITDLPAPARPTPATILTWLLQHWVGLTLLALTLAGALLRLFVLYKSHFIGDGDEALTGVAAIHILQGERPVFTYGQAYMAATESYFTALWYAIFGISSWGMKIAPWLASTSLIPLNYAVARRYFVDRRAGLFAAILTAFPTLYFMITSLRAWNHSTETEVGGDLLLLLAAAIIWGQPADRAARRWCGYTRREWLLWGLLGLMVGISFYGHMLAFFYYIPIIFFLFLKDKLFWLRPTTLIVLAGFFVGSAPWWFYNLTNHWQTIAQFIKPTDPHKEPALDVLGRYATHSWPLAVGATNFWFSTSTLIAIFLVGVYTLALLGWLVARRAGLAGWLRLSLEPGCPVDLLLLFVLCAPLLYLAWGAGNIDAGPLDTTGRYVLPLIAALPVLLGGTLAALLNWRPGFIPQASRVLPVIALAGLLAVTGANLNLYRHADFVATFQSPYFPELRPPVDNGPLISYLKSQGIEYATCNHWVGNRIILDSQDTLKCVDYHDLSVGGLDRFSQYSQAIKEPGRRVAFVLLNLKDGSASMEARLKELGVAYTRQEFLPYIVIIPTSRPVSPQEVLEQLHYPL